MMQTRSLILECLDSIQKMTGAETAVALLQLEPPARESMLLTCRAGMQVVSELSDENSAWEFIKSRPIRKPGSPQPVHVIRSNDATGVLVGMSFDSILQHPTGQRRDSDERRRQPDISTAPPIDGTMWIGLTHAPHVDAFVAALQSKRESGTPDASFSIFMSHALRLSWSVYHLTRVLHDPVGQLPGAMEFHVYLTRAIAESRQNGQSIALLLVNPDDFTMINHRYGRRLGDSAVREVAEQLAGSLRATDGVFRYGGAVFGAVLPATDLDQCRAATEKVRGRLTRYGYVDGGVKLTFSMGAVVASPQDLEVEGIEALLFERADAALNAAKLSGGARIIVANLDKNGPDSIPDAPFNGIFATNTEKDYRNMLLLWETVILVSAHPEPEAMAIAFVNRLAIGFQPDRVALFARDDVEGIKPLATNVRDDTSCNGRLSGGEVKLDKKYIELIARALRSKRVERSCDDKGVRYQATAYAVPLITSEHIVGCLFLDGSIQRLQLDSSDVIFLNALASQMAIALDRADLAARWIQEKDRENRQMRGELRELRQALHHTKMIYHSNEMHAVMDTLRKVAPTDATVLIVGESGTGKEMLAHAVHEMSTRHKRPFIVFDCGAVVHDLIESELFGHVKGAFTGADRASEGRISLANEGTLFLDEVGELPLQVQAKLLRFVQEKEFSPVGAAEPKRVDVRIVAATNRKLRDEVNAGRFRADLYYRLCVISVEAMPLRQRVADIIPLAHYFLEKFTAQYGTPARLFSPTAEHRLQQHSWPGNVRELQHCVLRVVLTHETDVIDADAIDLDLESDGPEAPVSRVSELPGQVPALAPVPDEIPGDPWIRLNTELRNQIKLAMSQNSNHPVPLGRWLTEDMVMIANGLCDNVARRAARLVGVPESTYRRHLDKVNSGTATGLNFRAPHWESVQPLLREIVNAANENHGDFPSSDLLKQARTRLLDGVEIETAAEPTTGAALMGVTPPTYKRWVAGRNTP